MAHQSALKSGGEGKTEDGGGERQAAQSEGDNASARAAAKPGKVEGAIYLATSLTMQRRDDQLIMALSGLPMPRAMTEPCERESLFAIPLQVENVHQLIQLIIDKAQEAKDAEIEGRKDALNQSRTQTEEAYKHKNDEHRSFLEELAPWALGLAAGLTLGTIISR